MSSKKKLRDFTKVMPEEHICPLCNLDNKDCECVKYKCKCEIEAINCVWPDCICNSCLNISNKCRCLNE